MNLNNFSEEATEFIQDILPPVKLLEECKNLSEKYPSLKRSIHGYSNLNNPIEVYEIREGEKNVLIYGFPDPSESIGGTTILALIKKLVENDEKLKSYNLKWIFIPCLNFDDQPHNGEKLGKLMKTSNQEVDWCLNNPRPETKVLVDIAENYKPFLVFPLHDEFHCNEDIPIYFPVAPKIDKNLADKLKEIIYYNGLEIDNSIEDKDMGKGFFYMPDKAPDYLNSTFSVFEKYGNVIEFELSDLPNVSRNKLCQIQVSIILEVIEYFLK
jgi:hypothetical protein